MAKTHPHIDLPAHQQLDELVSQHAAPIREAYLALHALMVEVVPEVRFSVDVVDKSIGYGARQFGYDGWGMAAVTPYTKWATLTLLQGAHLPDPTGLLTGSATMRHVKVTNAAEVGKHKDALTALLRAAAMFHSSTAK